MKVPYETGTRGRKAINFPFDLLALSRALLTENFVSPIVYSTLISAWKKNYVRIINGANGRKTEERNLRLMHLRL